jgi:lipid-A-disaccharide synthase
MRYFISAGEASGDIHAAALIKALRLRDESATFTFLGGDLMAAEAGCEPLIHYRDMAFMGFCEVIRHMKKVLTNLSTARNALVEGNYDALILVDYPSFNLKLAKEAHRRGVKVYYYISPKVWAWKEGRVKRIKKYVDKMLSILPFEVEFYRQRHGYEITYVGNPSVAEVDEKLAKRVSDEEFCRAYSLPTDKPLLALVPGSRRGEIRNNLPVMVEVARRHPELHAVVAEAPGIDSAFYDGFSDLQRVGGATFELMSHAKAALVTSGTATLEAALIGVPQVVCYRANGSKLSYKIFERILKIPFVSLPNLIANRSVVAEQLVHLCTPDLVDERLTPLLSDSAERRAMIEGYAEIRRRLTANDAATVAAQAILGEL